MDKVEDHRREVKEDLKWTSEHASRVSRQLCLSVVAVMWGLMTMASGQNALVISHWQHIALLLAGLSAVASLSADWVQSIAGYLTANRAYDRVYSPDYNPADKSYELRLDYYTTLICFWVKHSFAPLSVVILFVAVAPILYHGSVQPNPNPLHTVSIAR